MNELSENKQLMEDSARNLRCSGVSSARVVQVVAYKIVTGSDESHRLQRFQASGGDAPAPVPLYERD